LQVSKKDGDQSTTCLVKTIHCANRVHLYITKNRDALFLVDGDSQEGFCLEPDKIQKFSVEENDPCLKAMMEALNLNTKQQFLNWVEFKYLDHASPFLTNRYLKSCLLTTTIAIACLLCLSACFLADKYLDITALLAFSVATGGFFFGGVSSLSPLICNWGDMHYCE
jgi:hypothetical protein